MAVFIPITSSLPSSNTMPSIIAAPIPTLYCCPHLLAEKGQHRLPEHPVSRPVLIEVAPDREDTINSIENLDDFRDTLKIYASDPAHWLNQVREKTDARIRGQTMRMAPMKSNTPAKHLRRSHSASSLLSMSRRLADLTQNNSWVWDRKPIISTERVISPRPLEPTHLLVIYDTTPLSGIYSRYVECPINALVFAAYCPNLQLNEHGRTFPHRLPQELPRVRMEVPHLGAFVPLLAYLHTKNQAALFRALVPEWLRDILHPVVMAGIADPRAAPDYGHRTRKLSIRISSCVSVPLLELPQRTLVSVAQETRDAEARAPQPLGGSDVAETFRRLVGLKTDLEFIGYHPRDLWYELELMLRILAGTMDFVDAAYFTRIPNNPRTSSMAEESGQVIQGSSAADVALTKQQRNALSLVCSSPPEILQLIFGLYIIDKTWNNGKIPLIAILSHVCARWRAVCLDDYRLWTTISCDIRGRWTSEFAARSGHLPLDVYIVLPRPSPRPKADIYLTAQAALQNIHRVRSLRVEGRGEHLRAFLDALTDKPAPILESLSVFYIISIQTLNEFKRRLIPASIFAGSAPRLQCLTLDCVRLSHPPIPAFANLTTIRAKSASSVRDAWDLLRSITRVKTLHFSLLYDPRIPQPFAGSGPIDAPDLTSLMVHDVGVGKLVTLLDTIAAPSLAQIVFSNMEVTQFNAELFLDNFCRALSPHVEILRRQSGPMRKAILGPMEIICWPTYTDVFLQHQFTSPFHFAWYSTIQSVLENSGYLIRAVLGVLPVDEVRTLFVRDNIHRPIMSDERWSSLYPFVNVNVFNYAAASPTDALYVLRSMLPPAQRADIGRTLSLPVRDHVLFPQLEKLVITTTLVRTHGGKFLQVLSRLAQARRQGGVLLEIAFEDCPYSADVMVELKRNAVVTWNGAWCPPFSFGGVGEDPELENWEMWGSLFNRP
ncbi:hypothetical protein EVG20_g198 [Dentipellis fragilis]|uniref:F-box domain-containing protein n=1 Tax=Dentipellis fragilis TaxID=205917 RepID=A0A4Y9ZG91_9AGAM|nr:hypothetical protein EVG20_g198 [Dentipellis fragilis]